MKTTLNYVFSKLYFEIEETLVIEFENPPYIPESKVIIDIDYNSFFDSETADKIVEKLETDKHLLPYKTMEVWNDKEVKIVYEFMNTHKAVKYRAS